MVERFNRTLEAQLSNFIDEHQRDWDKHVPLLLMAYRTAVHDTTGETPAMIMLGRNLRLPIDLFIGHPKKEAPMHKSGYVEYLHSQMETVHNFGQEHLKQRSDKMKEYFYSEATECELERGDPVWLYNIQNSVDHGKDHNMW